jgi:hypothetical protein
MLANQAGAAAFWFWDAVENQNLYSVFRTASEVLATSELARHPNARSLTPTVTSPGTATLAFGPGAGWAPAGQTTFELPRDVNPASLAKLPGYLQSISGPNKALFPAPLVFRFQAPKPGTFKLSFDQVSKGGAKVKIGVNGQEVWSHEWASADSEKPLTDVAEIPFASGTNEIKIENSGRDWVRVAGFSLTDLAPQASALALGESDWMVLRLTAAPGVTDKPQVTVGGLSLADGDYDVTVFDLIENHHAESQLPIRNFTLVNFPMPSMDAIVVLKRKL